MKCRMLVMTPSYMANDALNYVLPILLSNRSANLQSKIIIYPNPTLLRVYRYQDSVDQIQ